jgi:hypothetical protein
MYLSSLFDARRDYRTGLIDSSPSLLIWHSDLIESAAWRANDCFKSILSAEPPPIDGAASPQCERLPGKL